MIRHALRLAVSVAALALAGGCVSSYVLTIETTVRAAMDMTAFRRVLVAGFIAGGTEEIDADVETTRLLRSQLRSRTTLQVIEADALPLLELATRERGSGPLSTTDAATHGPDVVRPRNEKELDPYRSIFAQAAFWKRIGEEYRQPLIVTGTVLFHRPRRPGQLGPEPQRFNVTARGRVVPARTWQEMQAYELVQTVVFIDGRTGNIAKIETYREEVSFSREQVIPALSAYFQLMDRVVPGILGVVSAQPIPGFRVLLK